MNLKKKERKKENKKISKENEGGKSSSKSAAVAGRKSRRRHVEPSDNLLGEKLKSPKNKRKRRTAAAPINILKATIGLYLAHGGFPAAGFFCYLDLSMRHQIHQCYFGLSSLFLFLFFSDCLSVFLSFLLIRIWYRDWY